jgi:hypothetical protein
MGPPVVMALNQKLRATRLITRGFLANLSSCTLSGEEKP